MVILKLYLSIWRALFQVLFLFGNFVNLSIDNYNIVIFLQEQISQVQFRRQLQEHMIFLFGPHQKCMMNETCEYIIFPSLMISYVNQDCWSKH